MDVPLDIDERRRRAPLHYHARADNARYCAWSLWTLMDSELYPDVRKAGYGGNPAIALHEGWIRERSLALENIVKAVIAQNAETDGDPKPPRPTHNVSQLWDEARLPKPDRDNRARLILTWQALQWSGRYAAPNRGSDGQRTDVERATKVKGSMLQRQPSFGWEEFDALYQLAQAAFFEAYERRFPCI